MAGSIALRGHGVEGPSLPSGPPLAGGTAATAGRSGEQRSLLLSCALQAVLSALSSRFLPPSLTSGLGPLAVTSWAGDHMAHSN